MSWVNLLALAKKGLNILEYERLTLVKHSEVSVLQFKTSKYLGFAQKNASLAGFSRSLALTIHHPYMSKENYISALF